MVNLNCLGSAKRSLSLGLVVSCLAACSGGNSSSSGDSSLNTSSDAPTVSSIPSVSSTASSIPVAVSSIAVSSAAASSAPVVNSSAASSSSQVSQPPVVGDSSPVADLSGTFPDVSLLPGEIYFKSDRSYDPDGVIAAVAWDFGDGTTSTQVNPSHTYNSAGTYQVSLVVTDADGMTGSTSMDVTVMSPEQVGGGMPPLAEITASKTRGEVPLTVSFSGTGSRSMGDIVSYKWDLGGGRFAYGPELDITFDKALSHQVYLTVTDDQGLSHSAMVQVDGLLSVPKGTPGAPLQTAGNPFAESAFYISPDIEKLQNESLDLVDPATEEKLYKDIQFVQQLPSAVWLDRTIAIYGGAENGGRRPLSQFYLSADDPYQGLGHFDEAVEQQKALADADGNLPPMTVVIIVYNLPDRDCAALASNGLLNETNDGDGDGEPDRTGMQAYKEDYIDVIAEIFARYPDLRIVAMLEPDGYPNMITNVGKGFDKCDDVDAEGVYERALQYAIAQFAPLDNVYTYLDIGHGGWLGWATNLSPAVRGFTNLVEGATESGSLDVIKGFASNTSGYTPLREPFISNAFADRMGLANFYEWNQQVDELSFIDALYNSFTAAGFSDDLGFIIDTARNGWGGPNRPTGENAPASKDDADFRIDRRKHRGHWCNVADAGIGEIPQAEPDPARPYLDAYYWMKPPGESDGISDPSAIEANEEGKSYDPMCGGESSNSTGVTADVLLNAPHAGSWFHEQFVMLINNAHPPLGQKEADPNDGGATASFVDDFESYGTGQSPRGEWDLRTDGPASAEISTERFGGLVGQSLKLNVSEENQYNDAVGMLQFGEDMLGAAASNFFGRVRLFVEDNGPEEGVDMKWTMMAAEGRQGQVSGLQYRFSVIDGKLAAVLDSNGRANECELVSSTPMPKNGWVCFEWQIDPKNAELNLWLNGERVDDLAINANSPGCSDGDWVGPTAIEDFYMGVGRYRPSGQQQQNPPDKPAKPDVTMFVDDLAFGNGRLGCADVRK